jgi:hypothetical protein
MSLLYSDGVYYEKTQVQGETQYKVVAPPPGATLPQNSVPADAATVTVAGTTYYYYGNVFYKVVPKDGAMGFVSVDIPAGVPTLAALPADVQPQQAGSSRTSSPAGSTTCRISTSLVPRSTSWWTPPRLRPARPRGPDQVHRPDASGGHGPERAPGQRRQLAEQGGDRFQGISPPMCSRATAVATKGTKVYGRWWPRPAPAWAARRR